GGSGAGVRASRGPGSRIFVAATGVEAAVATAEVAGGVGDGRVLVEVGDEVAGSGVVGDEPGQVAGRHAAPVTATDARLERRSGRRLRRCGRGELSRRTEAADR